MGIRRTALLSCAACMGLMAMALTQAQGQDVPNPNQLEQELRSQLLSPLKFPTPFWRPAANANTPMAHGLSQYQAVIGGSFQERTRYSHSPDTAFHFSIGLGDAEVAALQINLNVLETQPFGRRGSFDLKLHHKFSEKTAIAIGVENTMRWHESDVGTSYFGVASHQINLKPNGNGFLGQLYVSLGIGDGRFRTEDQVMNNTGSLGVFGSVAVSLATPLRAFAEWTGQDLYLGLSIAPIRGVPFIITPAVADVTHTAGDGPRFVLGAGFLFNY